MLNDISPFVISVLAFSSVGGLTFLLAVLNDLINLLTLHITLCAKITGLVFSWQLDSLGSLFNLFRGASNSATSLLFILIRSIGKRWNVLRERTDTYEYDIDQLFLGTLLFTVSAFLFPTVLTYTAFFAAVRIALHRSIMEVDNSSDSDSGVDHDESDWAGRHCPQFFPAVRDHVTIQGAI